MKTPVPSQYPVLDNKPIDQWKVTELKEELKRRKLTTRGLKDDLVRRLDEALRAEMYSELPTAAGDAADDGNDNGAGGFEPESVFPGATVTMTEQPGVVEGTLGIAGEGGVGNADESVVGVDKGNVGDASAGVTQVAVDVKDSVELVGEGKSEELQSGFISDPAAPGVGLETAMDDVVSQGLVSDPAAPDVGVVSGTDASEGLSVENVEGRDWLLVDSTEKLNGDSRAQQHSEDIKLPNEDVKLDSSVPNSQVSEVSSSLGFPVKSNNSISTDSVSIIEKNDLKDNIIADNVKLESDLKPEMVHPSSSDLVTDGGQSHPRDVDEPHENKVSVEETENTLANAEMSHKNYSADMGSPEKLNLDRSSGDDSMEEDALESKQIDSTFSSEVVEKSELKEVPANKGEIPVGTMDTDLPVEKKMILDEKNDVLATSFDKRKLSDEEAVVNNKPAKRQHRNGVSSNSVTEHQISKVSPPTASAKDGPRFATLKRNFSRSDSMGVNDPPKEREVPPSTNPATNSLRIDNFLRPFTLKAVQELLGKTGTVASFWMDHIKTHCYVTYSSVEEAVETRNAVYNLQWPPNGGRQLVANFVDAEEVKLRLEPPPPPAAAPVKPVPTKAPEPPMIPLVSPRQQRLKQRLTEQPAIPSPPPMLNRAPPSPPPLIEKVEAPIVTLDDLFRKTKATPRIYYLPLSEEEVAERRRRSEQ